MRKRRMVTNPWDRGGQAKMAKSKGFGWASSILHLAPHKSVGSFWKAYKAGDSWALRVYSKSAFLREAVELAESIPNASCLLQRFNACKGASAECIKACLYSAGRGIFPDVAGGRLARTMLLILQPDTFWE